MSTNVAVGQLPPDPLFPSSFFAKVPAEALSKLAHCGPTAMTHAEFRVFVALARFRGPRRVVNPTRETLESMTGMTPNNVSRCTKALQKKGWLTVHYAPGREKREVANYELHLPDPAKRAVEAESTKGEGETSPKTRQARPEPVEADLWAEPRTLSDDELDELFAEQLAQES